MPPDPFGLLKPFAVGPLGGMPSLPSLPQLPRLGDPIGQYLPTQGMIAGARTAIEEEKPWWAEILEVPDELFGGQSFKALLAGDVGGAFMKNPLFQLIDMVLPGQPLTGDDIRFSDVRKAWGGRDVEEGWGNFFLNLVGELFTDPSTFILMGSKAPGLALSRGTASAKEQGRLSEWLIRAEQGSRATPGHGVSSVFPWEVAGPRGTTPGASAFDSSRVFHKGALPEQAVRRAEATEMGLKHMMTWKIPWRVDGRWGSAGFVVPMPKGLSIGFARALDNWADWINSNPVTAPIMQAFSKAALPGASSGDVRLHVAEGTNRVAKDMEAAYANPLLQMMTRQARALPPEAMNDPDVLAVIATISEHGGIKKADQDNIVDLLQTGRSHYSHVARRKRHVSEGFVTEKGDSIAVLWRLANDGEEWAAKKLYDLEYAIPEDMLQVFGLKPRPGIDVVGDPSIAPIDVMIAERLGDAKTGGIASRKVTAEEVAGGPAGEAATVQEARRSAADLYASVRDKYGDEATQGFVEVALAGREIMEAAGRVDLASGVISAMTEFYLPRDLNPVVAETLNRHFFKSVGSNFDQGALDFVRSFMKQRKVHHLTTWEMNYVFRELGTRYSGKIPLKEFEFGVEEGILASAAKVFDNKFIRALKKDKSRSAQIAAQFFETNPFHVWQRRIEKSAQVHGWRGLMRHLFNEDSPFVQRWDTLDEALTAARGGAEMVPRSVDGVPLVAVLVHDDGFKMKGLGKTELFSQAHGEINAARFHIARQAVYDDAKEKILVAGRDMDDVITEIDEALGPDIEKLTRGRDVARAEELSGVANLRNLRWQLKHATDPEEVARFKQEIKDATAALKETRDELAGVRSQLSETKRYRVSERRKAVGGHRALLDAVKEEKDLRARLLKETQERLRERGATNPDEFLIAKIQEERGILALQELEQTDAGRALLARMHKNRPKAKVAWIHPDDHEAVWGKKGVLEYLRRPDRIGGVGIMRWLDENTSWWKWWTLLPPWFAKTRARDYIADNVMMLQGGVNPLALAKGWKQAARIEAGLQQAMGGGDGYRKLFGSVDLDAPIIIGGKELPDLTIRQFLHEMQSRGLLDSSLVRDMIGITTEEMSQLAGKKAGTGWSQIFQGILPPLVPVGKLKALAGKPLQNPMIRMGYRVAEFGNNHARISGVLAGLEEGLPLKEAIERTRLWTYDARKGLTTFERHTMRRMIPFYAWLKFAVRTQVGAYFTRPGTVTAWNKLHDSARKMIGMSDKEMEIAIPEFIKDNMGIPYRRDKNGNPEFAMFGGYFPVGDIQRIVNAVEKMGSGEGEFTALHWLAENTNPYVKNILENMLNYSFFSQRKIEMYPGQPTEYMGMAMSRDNAHLFRLIRTANDINKLIPLSKAQAEALLQAEQMGGAEVPGFLQRFLGSSFSPFPTTRPVDVQRELSYRVAEAEREEGLLKGQLRKVKEEPHRKGAETAVPILQEHLADKAARKQMAEDLRMQHLLRKQGR